MFLIGYYLERIKARSGPGWCLPLWIRPCSIASRDNFSGHHGIVPIYRGANRLNTLPSYRTTYSIGRYKDP